MDVAEDRERSPPLRGYVECPTKRDVDLASLPSTPLRISGLGSGI